METPRRNRRGFTVVMAMIGLTIVALIASATLDITSLDERAAVQDMRHTVVLGAAMSGQDIADELIEDVAPDEAFNLDEQNDWYIAEADTASVDIVPNMPQIPKEGDWRTENAYLKCGIAPPGFSSEIGPNSFYSDYWLLMTTARIVEGASVYLTETQAQTGEVIRQLRRGTCAVR